MEAFKVYAVSKKVKAQDETQVLYLLLPCAFTAFM
jgi:hypothetical protein